MKKTTPLSGAPQGNKKNGKGHALVPEALTPAVAQAVLEDAVLGIAADRAAAAAAMQNGELLPDADDILLAVIEPETPEEKEMLELLTVPFLGRTRVQALADSGIHTVADLNAASADQIGGVKGIGMGNAVRIKDWLATQAPAAAPGNPPPPPGSATPAQGTPPVAASPDPALAVDNAVIFDSLGEIDALLIVLRGSLGDGGLAKRLERQFDKVSSVTSELAEGPDTLTQKQLQQAVKLLKRIVDTLQEASERKRLSDKKQDALAEELRDHRKALQKVIGD